MSKNNDEKTVENLQNEVKRLEKLVEVFRDTITRLEKENKELTEKCESLDGKKVSHPHIEDNVVKLQKKVAKLEIENKDLQKEINTLKGVKEESQEPVGTVQQLIQARHAVMESRGTIEDGETWKIKQIPEIKSGKVADLVKSRQTTMAEQEPAEPSPPVIKKAVIEHEIETVARPEPTPPSSQAASVSEKPKITVIETAEGRRTCPNCGNQNQRLIHEVIDKNKLISVYPRMYGKKFKCGDCGIEWR